MPKKIIKIALGLFVANITVNAMLISRENIKLRKENTRLERRGDNFKVANDWLIDNFMTPDQIQAAIDHKEDLRMNQLFAEIVKPIK